MIGITFNVRGLGGRVKISKVKELVLQQRVELELEDANVLGGVLLEITQMVER